MAVVVVWSVLCVHIGIKYLIVIDVFKHLLFYLCVEFELDYCENSSILICF